MAEIDFVVAEPAVLGECPVWSAAEGVLYWADIDGRAIHRYDPTSGLDEAAPLPGRPGSFALSASAERLLVALELRLVWFDRSTGVLDPWVDLEPPDRGNRSNDGRCDPAGRFVVGTMWPDTGDGLARGGLHRVGGDGTVETLEVGVGVPNGLAFDAARRRMYFADTPTRIIRLWDYDPDTGHRSGERVFFDYGDLPGKPDGACVDADGCYWSASVRGGAVIRITPEGTLDRRIELPVGAPTMPAFGGPDLTTLYVTSIGDRLLALDAGVAGIPEPTFDGGEASARGSG